MLTVRLGSKRRLLTAQATKCSPTQHTTASLTVRRLRSALAEVRGDVSAAVLLEQGQAPDGVALLPVRLLFHSDA